MSVASANATPRPTLLSILRERNFALLWSGQAISQIGDGLFSIALIWLVLQLTGSALAMGTTVILTQLPRLAFQLIGGVSVDRYDRRMIMLWSDALRGTVMLIFAILVATNQIQLVHVYILAIVFGIVGAFFQPAMSALIPNLVPKDGLIPANALTSLTKQASQIIGPVIAGILIAIPSFGIAGVSFLNAVSFGAGVIGMGLMRLPAHLNGNHKTDGSFWRELGDGFRYLLRFRALVIILFLAMVLNFALAPVEVVLPIFVKITLGMGSEGFGVLMSAFGVGMVAGSIGIGIRAPRTRRGIFVFALTTLGGFLFAGVGLFPVFAVTFALMVAFGFLIAVVNTVLNAMMQGMIADEYRGRVFSVSDLISMGMMPVGLAVGGALADVIGAGMVIAAGGLLTAGVALTGFVFPEIRELQ